jgi:hypothetical protein
LEARLTHGGADPHRRQDRQLQAGQVARNERDTRLGVESRANALTERAAPVPPPAWAKKPALTWERLLSRVVWLSIPVSTSWPGPKKPTPKPP